jgi:hypothetical protein
MKDRDRLLSPIERAKALEEEGPSLSMEEINTVSNALGVISSKEFVDFSLLYRYDYLCAFEWSCFHDEVVPHTLDLRKKGLPYRYVLLADEGDAGSIFLETQDAPEKPSPVIWCAMEDVYNLCDGKGCKYDATIWPTFADFFEYLVGEEEKERAEEAQENA